jgi:hypothetical protein
MGKLLLLILCWLIPAWSAVALPLSHTLEAMTPGERANAVISIDIDSAAPQQAEEARSISGLWNAGDHESALGRLSVLEGQVNPDGLELCISWRMPVAGPTPDWGNDVLISAEDSVFAVSLARDHGSSNLFAVLSRMNGSSRYLMLCFSSDGGASWSTTYNIAGSGRCPTTAMVMGNYCYLAYGRSSSLRLRRFYLSTGYSANLNNGSTYHDIISTTTDTIREVKLAELYYNTQLCCGTLHADGKLRMFWTYDSGGIDWQQFASPESAAKRGLDMYGNYPYSSYLLFACYINNANVLRLLGLGSGAVWDTLVSGPVDSNAYFTAVGAYRDTVLAAFENRVSGDYRIQSVYSVNGGSSWTNGFLTPSDTNCYCPDLAMNRGGGVGMTFIQAMPQSHRFSWWPYSGGYASTSVVSYRAVTTAYQPAVEYLGGTAYGVAYISPSSDLNRAYFDRSDWTGVAEKPDLELKVGSLKLLPNAPNPFEQITTIRYQLTRPGKISLKVYNAAGQCVRDLTPSMPSSPRGEGWVGSVIWDGRDDGGRMVASGIYLYRLEAGGEAAIGRMTVVR